MRQQPRAGYDDQTQLLKKREGVHLEPVLRDPSTGEVRGVGLGGDGSRNPDRDARTDGRVRARLIGGWPCKTGTMKTR